MGPDVVIASLLEYLKVKMTVTEKQKTKHDLSVLHVESKLPISFILTVGFISAGIYYLIVMLEMHTVNT